MKAIELAEITVKIHEGLRLEPYKDTVGKITIGYGRNLDDIGISKAEALILLQEDLANAAQDAEAVISAYSSLSTMRKAVLIDMAFNLGRSRLSKFKKMIKAINDGDYKQASFQMLDSKWAVQVSKRADYLARKMSEGV